MMRTLRLSLLAVPAALLALTLAAAQAADDKKGTEIVLDDLKSAPPATWKSEEPSNKMRFAQFKLPKAKDDKEDAELVIFKGLGGAADANVKRWKEQFLPPTGKSIDDVAKVENMKVGGYDATYLDVSGTYKFRKAPFDPNAKEERLPNYRMLAVHLEGKDIYHIKLTGPEKTIAEHKKGFDDWLKGLKK